LVEASDNNAFCWNLALRQARGKHRSVRSCERIAGATARSHSRLGKRLITLGSALKIWPGMPGHYKAIRS